VVLTGASSGIARASAVELSRRGANVVLAARDRNGLASTASDCAAHGAQTLTVPTDVSDLAQVEELARRAFERFGCIDAWVNAAAVISYGHFEKTPWDAYRQVLETNLFGQLHGARAALPYFRQQYRGVLVNVASVWGSVTSPYVSAYVTSKFAIRAFSECLQQGLRLEKDMKQVHVCTVLPQSVDTPIFRHAANYTDVLPRPVPPIVTPQRVARTIARTIEHPRRQRTVGLPGRGVEFAYAAMPSLYGCLAPWAMRLLAFRDEPAQASPGNIFDSMPEWNKESGGWR
jgi:short-subunit dehydrogenase